MNRNLISRLYGYSRPIGYFLIRKERKKAITGGYPAVHIESVQ